MEALGLKVVVWQASSRGDQIQIEQSPASPFDVTGVVDAREDAAAALSGAGRAAAFASLDADLMRQVVPIAPFANGNQRDAFSSRIGCQTFNAVVGIDIVDLCVKEPTANGG